MWCLPIALNVAGRDCLVIGGGEIAARKVRLLLRFDAKVRIVAPALEEELQSLLAENRVQHICAEFDEAHLHKPCLVIAATNNKEVNQQVSALAHAQSIPVNVVDEPKLCSFVTPSILFRSPLLIAISSGGVAPILARMLRARLEAFIPGAYGNLAELLGRFREPIRQCYPEVDQRRRFLDTIIPGKIENLVLAGREEEAERELQHCLQAGEKEEYLRGGEVYLVGGGPGDPDLLTFKALRLMQQADVVLYDRLVAKPVLELVRRDAQRIYVGKQCDQHTIPQTEINQHLVDLARQGKRVLRLKGGDPFIFGRGGEEIADLAAAGIPWQIVPGITAASGCASYAGIPLTHRDYAHSCLLVTAHLKENKLDLNWEAMLQPHQTTVIYMGIHSIDMLCAGLIEHGMRADFPAAVVECGTMKEQKTHAGVVGELATLVKQRTVKPPSLIILGEVVRLHAQLGWYRTTDS